MKSAIDMTENHLMLLSTLDLDEVAEAVAAIVMQVADPKSVSVLVWDQDLEMISDKYVYGPRKRDFTKFTEAFAEEAMSSWTHKTPRCNEVDLENCEHKLSAELNPLFIYRIDNGERRAGIILIAGDPAASVEQLTDALQPFPLFEALSNAWEVRELRRENERLRARYEELEDRNSVLEEQTRKLIHDTMVKDTLRTQHVDRERLVYEISNTVRSSLEIRLVLQTAVNKIGRTFNLSRCILLRPLSSPEKIAVYEYSHESVPSAKDQFFSDEGDEFVQTAFRKTAPYDFGDLEDERTFNTDFLRQLGVLSGLLVPLIMRDRNIGTIFLQDCVTPRQWSIDNTALFGSLADQLSVAIENADLHQEKTLQAVTDGLTGIANRRHFNETFQKEFERAKRYGEPLSLIVVDLDYLKRINDKYGHHVGDEAIKIIGSVLAGSCRSIDLPARYGGEEFCILLPNTDIDMAQIIAERVRKLVSEAAIEGPGNITASIGVANFPLHAAEPDVLFQAADEALYAAKAGGRDRVCAPLSPPR